MFFEDKSWLLVDYIRRKIGVKIVFDFDEMAESWDNNTRETVKKIPLLSVNLTLL